MESRYFLLHEATWGEVEKVQKNYVVNGRSLNTLVGRIHTFPLKINFEKSTSEMYVMPDKLSNVTFPLTLKLSVLESRFPFRCKFYMTSELKHPILQHHNRHETLTILLLWIYFNAPHPLPPNVDMYQLKFIPSHSFAST